MAGEPANNLEWADTCYALYSASVHEFLETHEMFLHDPATLYAWDPNGYPYSSADYPWLEFDMQALSDSGVVTAADLCYWQYTTHGAAENSVSLVATDGYSGPLDSMVNRIVTGTLCADTLAWPQTGFCVRPLNTAGIAAIEAVRATGSGRLQLGLPPTHNVPPGNSGELHNYTQPQKPRLAVHLRESGAVSEPDRTTSGRFRLTIAPSLAHAGFITADVIGTRRGRVQYKVRTVVGTKLISGDKATEEDRTRILVDMGQLPAGVYMFTIADNKMSATQRFTIAR